MAHRMVNGVRVEMTPQEETDFEASRTPTLHEAKQVKKRQVLREWVKAERKGIAYQAKTIETDVETITRIGVLARRARQAKDDGVPFGVAFIAADDSIMQLNRAEILALDQAVGDYFKAVADAAKVLLQAVRDAADLQVVMAIDVSAGWP